MKKIRNVILISALALLLASAAACSGGSTTVTVTATPQAPAPNATQPVSTAPTTTVTITVPAFTPALTVPPSATTTANPVASSITAPAASANFFIQKEIASYNRVMKIDGTYDETPVYVDSYLKLEELFRYSPADAVYVPRIPTLTDHDDWFIRVSIPTSTTKPWEVNWAYALKPGDSATTVSFAIYTQDDFNNFYYNKPSDLTTADMKSGDKGVSAEGIHARLMTSPGNYVIVMRTNNAAGVSGWWVRIGM